tara:strand:+ start:732 stop:1136 length:405 start_codon:yes stop_codon:yes gene_type:complete
MVDTRALKETLQQIPKDVKRVWKKDIDKVKKVVKSEAFKDTVKDLPRVVKEQAKKGKDIAKKVGKAALIGGVSGVVATKVDASKKDKKDKKDKGRKYNPNKVIEAKTGGLLEKCKIDGIAKKGFTKAYSLKKGK